MKLRFVYVRIIQGFLFCFADYKRIDTLIKLIAVAFLCTSYIFAFYLHFLKTMKIQFLLFLYFVTSQSAKLRKKRDDDFILSGPLSPSNNKGDENDGFILVGNTDDNKNNDKDDEDDFIREGNPDSDKSDTVELPPGVGTFWHLTDVHWDRYYNWKAASKSRVCPSSNGAETLDAGPFGDYRY